MLAVNAEQRAAFFGALQVLAAEDFEDARRYLMVDQGENFPTYESTANIIEQARRFMALVVATGDEIISIPVDPAIHSMLMFPGQMRRLEAKLGINLFDHHPTLGDADRAVLAMPYAQTRGRLADLLGEISTEWWPENGQVCGGNGCGSCSCTAERVVH